MASVKVIEAGRVAVPTSAAPASDKALLRLSALDAQWLPFPLIQRVLVFHSDGVPPFDAVVASLRASLAVTVARFLPLAGRIVHLLSSGEAAIDCSEEGVSGGVRFLVAESDADAGRLAGEADHDVAVLERLAPVLDAGALPAETMAVQVTRLAGGGGGVAIGVAMHHAVVDGRSVWMFLEAWATSCRGDAAPAPTFDRAAVALPDGEEMTRSVYRKYMPDLPVVTMSWPLLEDRLKLSRQTFTVAAPRIRQLKQHIARLTCSPPSSAPVPLSSFVAIAALSWVSFVRSKHAHDAISTGDDVYLFFFIDCRGRRGIDPPVGESYFGTCISGCLVKAMARDLLADDGIAAAASAVQAEVQRGVEDPLAGWEWMTLAGWVPQDRVVNMSGSTRFPAYEAADFGWGTPNRTELATMNHDGQVVLVAAKDGAGGVQASVAMDRVHMDTFNSYFVNYLG